jgi:hypothetical protein
MSQMAKQSALKLLVTKLEEIEADSSFQGIWPFLDAHGYCYSGPSWENELALARKELKKRHSIMGWFRGNKHVDR